MLEFAFTMSTDVPSLWRNKINIERIKLFFFSNMMTFPIRRHFVVLYFNGNL
jgi:hypothetical protein